jgi:hypothetical protein
MRNLWLSGHILNKRTASYEYPSPIIIVQRGSIWSWQYQKGLSRFHKEKRKYRNVHDHDRLCWSIKRFPIKDLGISWAEIILHPTYPCFNIRPKEFISIPSLLQVYNAANHLIIQLLYLNNRTELTYSWKLCDDKVFFVSRIRNTVSQYQQRNFT